MKDQTIKFNALLEKVNKIKKDGGVDLDVSEDLSLAVMNLISLEEHFFFTGMKTGKGDYHDFTSEIRDLRKELLAKLIDKHEGETWCISKHLLSSTMRLIEVGNKYHAEGKKEEAKEMFDKAYKIYSIFVALKEKLITGHSFDEVTTKPWSFEKLMGKLSDCCNE